MHDPANDVAPPTLAEIDATAERLDGRILRTPVLEAVAPELRERLPPGTEVNLKLELFQHTGSFKARGALNVLLGLSPEALARGVTAVSAGNHAIATAWAAREVGTHAKVVMFKSANPARIEKVRRFGGEVVIAEDPANAFEVAEAIRRDEGRHFVHPYEGPATALGTATIGREWLAQTGALDAVVVPVGGGGLIAGIATAIKLERPDALVFGVEPEGADSMTRSFASGRPERLERVATIADSLGAPFALPYSYGLCRRSVDAMVTVSDAQIRAAMRLCLDTLKLMLEPAAATALAGLLGPLAERLAGRRVGVIVCGSNIDVPTFVRMLDAA